MRDPDIQAKLRPRPKVKELVATAHIDVDVMLDTTLDVIARVIELEQGGARRRLKR